MRPFPSLYGRTSPRTSPHPRWPGMPSIPFRPFPSTLPYLRRCLFFALGQAEKPEAPIYSLIRSKRVGMPGAYLLVGAHSDATRLHRASRDAHRSGHPRPCAPTSSDVWRSGGAHGPGKLARGATVFDSSKSRCMATQQSPSPGAFGETAGSAACLRVLPQGGAPSLQLRGVLRSSSAGLRAP